MVERNSHYLAYDNNKYNSTPYNPIYPRRYMWTIKRLHMWASLILIEASHNLDQTEKHLLCLYMFYVHMYC